MKYAALTAAAGMLLLAGCGDVFSSGDTSDPAPAPKTDASTPVDPATSDAENEKPADAKTQLAEILKSQPKAVRDRYKYRKPARTVEFFQIEPGMTVVEALPGGGWYTKILAPYLGESGTLIGGQYPDDLWIKFGFGEEWAAQRVEQSSQWVATATEWGIENGASFSSATLTAMPEDAAGTVDAVLFIRALHNLSRFNDDDSYLDATIAESFRVLKPGGIVGVVQHAASEDAPDESTKGQRGYLKQSTVIAQFEAAGFVLEKASELHANPKDQPGADQIVWRLPPTLNGTEEGSPERAAFQEIGESNRMTLRFRKPK